MKRFDVFENPDGKELLLNVQSNLLDELNTRIVVPLISLSKSPKPAKRLNPTFHIDGTEYVMATQYLAAVPTIILKSHVTNLSEEADNIQNALDMAFIGF